MPLDRGARLGPYEVQDIIGAGGMGEVFRARDTRLDRDVAVKLLPDAFVHDEERIARFQREAKVLASLNHPNIAAIYGLEDTASGGRALVMELVEGPTLADRIGGRPLPVEDVRAIAIEIAAALEVAHEQGIVHRDLKPANVKVRDDGRVKVLDFGLAKVRDTSMASSDVSHSPTITSPAMTERGIILGTAAYMSPEQARGRPVDKRADIWSFGVVLYEMLTGRRPFEGEDASETLANILKLEPAYEAIPPAWRTLVRRCLTKDPKKRLRDIGDAAFELDALTASAGEPAGDGTLRRRVRMWRVAAIAATAGLVAVVTTVAVRQATGSQVAPATLASASFEVPLPPDTSLMMIGKTLALARDGRALAYIAERRGAFELYRRDLASLETALIQGATDPWSGLSFSPNGERLLFSSSAGRLITVPTRGGAPESICPGAAGSATWIDSGSILFSTGGLVSTPTARCAPEPLTTIDGTGFSVHRWPESVEGGTMALFTEVRTARAMSKIMAVDRTSRTQHEVTDGTFARFAPPGWLFFARRQADGTAQLLVAPFDPATAVLTGPATVLVDQIGLDSTGGAQYAVSANGVLAYATSSQAAVRILGPNGDVQASFPVGQDADMIAVSPDGRRALVTFDSRVDIVDLERGVADRLSVNPGQYKFPAWLRDGKQISYRYLAPAQTEYEVVLLDLAQGTREVLVKVPSDPEAGGISTWSSDGRTAFGNYRAAGGSHDVFRWSRDGARQLEPVIATPGLDANARLSPDGRLLAFVGAYGGSSEVYVQPVAGGERVRVSTSGAVDPNWTPDGRALMFRYGNRIFSSAITANAGRISAGTPRLIAERPLQGRLWSYGIRPDGRLVTLERGAPVSSIHVVLNWPRLLRHDVAP